MAPSPKTCSTPSPGPERSAAGPFDNWPTGLGFAYCFGFPHGDTDQFEPILYRGTAMADPGEGKGEILDKRRADDLWLLSDRLTLRHQPTGLGKGALVTISAGA